MSVTAVTGFEVLVERHQIVHSIAGLVISEEYLISIQTPELELLYEISVLRDFTSGEIDELRVYPAPSPPPVVGELRRGWHWHWTN